MSKKIVPLVTLPSGELCAFFGFNCVFNLHVINPRLPLNLDRELIKEPTKWPIPPLVMTPYIENILAGERIMG